MFTSSENHPDDGITHTLCRTDTEAYIKIVYGTYYLYRYQDEDVKNIILKLKNGDSKAIYELARSLYEAILNQITANHLPSGQISVLILHVPSSSFGIGKKDKDHMAILLEYLAGITTEVTADKTTDFAPSEKSPTKELGSIKVQIDIAPYIFRHTKPPHTSQHHKDRSSRINQSIDKFEFASHVPPLLLAQYSYIYIVDDVVTTGSSLQALKRLLTAYCSKHRLSPIIRSMALSH